jgi:hypothetical protein
MTPINSFLRFSQRLLRRAGNDLIRTANRLPIRDQASASQRQTLQHNESLKNKHKGQRAFVIGTGPSLASQNLEPLANEVTFVMNAFWQHPIVEKWQPTYYLLSDSVYFDQSEQSLAFLRSMKARISSSIYFAPLHFKERIIESGMLPVERTNWIGLGSEFHDPGTRIDNIDFTDLVPNPRSVSQLCIMAAIYLGCSPIYLLGLDHDWLAHMGQNRHFYQGHAGFEAHPKHKPVLADWGYRANMESQLILWSGYEKLREIADRDGCRIINATNGGFLDVFERANYEEVIGLREIQN